jgi:hypothetical protein
MANIQNMNYPAQTPSPSLQNRPQAAPPSSRRGRRAAKWLISLIVLALLAAAVAFGYWQYQKSQKLNKELTALRDNPQKAAQDETKELIGKVAALIVLPETEQPTVATVTDLEPLKDQPFFARAKIGFKVLIYTQAKRAILYDPVSNKIVEVAPLNIGDNTAPPANSSP